MAYSTASKSVGEVVDHASFGDDERVSCSKRGEHLWWRVLYLFCRNDVVEAMNVAVVELVVVEMILLLLPLRDVRGLYLSLSSLDGEPRRCRERFRG